ncbi:MAG: glycoside hydrolase family 65 protein [Firmicutes bacterium]|nr:glycoside hydrolase family 65 protein [Bacillota bacterium]
MKLTRTGYKPDEIALRETLFHVANGYLGVRACPEEGTPANTRSIRGAYLNAFYDTYPIQYAERLYGFPNQSETIVNVPDMQSISVHLAGELFDPGSGTLLTFEQTLDMDAGLYIRHMVWRSPKGRETEITFRRMASFAVRELFTIHVTILPKNWAGAVRLISKQNGDVRNDGDPNDPRKASEVKHMLRIVESGAREKYMYMQCETMRSHQTVACAATHTSDSLFALQQHSNPVENNATLESRAKRGKPLSFVKWCVYTDSRRHTSTLSTAVQLVNTCAETPIETWYEQQRAFLKDFWIASRITLEGEPSLQAGVDYAAYALLQSAGQDGQSSIASKGLSGEGYEGHYFWDTEIYMFPFFLLTQPQIAKALLEYRYATLDGARSHARLLGHTTGALYPWRTITGSECSSYFPSGSAQYHINSDIAYAVYTYYFVTGDLDFIRDKGADILIETARLWLSVGHWHMGQFRIDGVTGPDEYTCLINNNYYTNLSVKYHLQYTLYLCRLLQEAYPELDLEERYGLTDAELAAFAAVPKAICLPYDDSLGIYAQDDSFLQKQKMDLSQIGRQNLPLLLHYHPLFFYRQQVCKQADAVLAHFLFEDGIDDEVIRRTYDYYEAITTHDSSLSPCVFSMMAARIGDPEKALRYYLHTLHLDLEDKQGNTKVGIHAANMGGSYMGIVFGFAGLRIRPDSLSLCPSIPASIGKYAFSLLYRNKRIRIEVTQEAVTLRADGPEPVNIRVYDTVYPVTDEALRLDLERQPGA